MRDTREQALKAAADRVRGLRDRLRAVLPEDAAARYWWSGDSGRSLTELVVVTTSLDFGDTTLTHHCPGLIGTSLDTLVLVAAYNAAKDTLRDAVMDLRQDYGAHKARRIAEEQLRQWISPRLSLRQSYRHLLHVDAPIARVTFTMARAHRPIERVTRAEAEAIVTAIFRVDEDRERAMATLDALPTGTALYRVYPPQSHLRANVVFTDGHKRMLAAHSPILFPMPPGGPPPRHNTEPRPAQARKVRRDRRIADHPLIPHTPIHTEQEVAHNARAVADSAPGLYHPDNS